MTESAVDPRRSALMSRVRAVDTTPEMRVRRALTKLGLRYRLHAKELPGSPDVVFRKRKLAIFVHGCFWHRHPGCRMASTPKTRTEFWQAKFDRNVARDASVEQRLSEAGWRSVVVWECQTKNEAELLSRLAGELDVALPKAELSERSP